MKKKSVFHFNDKFSLLSNKYIDQGESLISNRLRIVSFSEEELLCFSYWYFIAYIFMIFFIECQPKRANKLHGYFSGFKIIIACY